MGPRREGDSPIFVDVKIGTVPRELPVTAVGDFVLLRSIRMIAAAVCLPLVCCCTAAAMPTPSSAAREAAKPLPALGRESPAPRVEESQPSIYYLPDKQGNLQPVLDFKYEEFVDLYRLKNQLGRRDQPPRYTLQRMAATATAAETYAELTVQFQAVVRDNDWVRIPLRLDQGLLRGPVQYKGTGKQIVQYEGEGVGYVCWIRGKPDSQHEITLSMLVPMDSTGDETRLKLCLPRATTSEMKLTAPVGGAVGAAAEGGTLLSSVAKGATTEFTVVGLGGDLQLAWRKSSPASVQTPVVIEATGTVLATLDGRGISSEATLSVRSHGAAFDRLTVRLPPEAELSAGKPNGYTVTALRDKWKAKGGKPAGPRSVEVRLAKKTVGPVEIHLNCRRAYEPAKSADWCELAGFEVIGAVRQAGTLTVAAGSDWQVLWGPSRETHRVAPLPSGSHKDDVLAGFEYSCQPYSLAVKLAPRKTRISIEPEYVLLVDRSQVRLEGKLTYTIRGAKVSTLEIAIPGWELDEIGPDSLVAADDVRTTSGVVSIPLNRPSSGSVELQLRAHRTIESQATSLAVSLPRPQGGAVTPSSLAVVAADNLELTPNAQAMTGLVRQRIAPPMNLPARQQEPLYYRGGDGNAVFAAGFRVLRQRITVEAAGEVTLGERTATVEQRFCYSIAHQPVEQLTISVPSALAANRIRLRIDGRKPISPVLAAQDLGEAAGGTASANVTLPEPRIGPCELTLSYTVPLPALDVAGSGGEAVSGDSKKTTCGKTPAPIRPRPVDVPLLMPVDGELLANTLTVTAERNTRISLGKGAWIASDQDPVDADGRPSLQVTAARRSGAIALQLRRDDNGRPKSIIVDRAWVQSRLTSTARQDRAVFQLTTDRNEIEVALPADAVESAVALVDGRQVEPRLLGDNRMAIPLGGRGGQRRVVVELRYHFAGPRPPRGAIRMDFPRLSPEGWMRRMYWQLILPANEHLVGNPDGFTGEFVWQWSGWFWFWGRRPLLDQAELESWAETAPRDALPERVNVYLFSSLGNVEQAEVRTAARTWIVLWASGAALVAGLLLIYLPVSRHPATLLTIGMALLAAGLIAPEPTLLLAQAACLGLVLTLLAGLLERGAARRRRRFVGREPSSSLVEIGSTHSGFRKPAADNPPSTAAIHPSPPQPMGNTEP
jgi:hypothetical protein